MAWPTDHIPSEDGLVVRFDWQVCHCGCLQLFIYFSSFTYIFYHVHIFPSHYLFIFPFTISNDWHCCFTVGALRNFLSFLSFLFFTLFIYISIYNIKMEGMHSKMFMVYSSYCVGSMKSYHFVTTGLEPASRLATCSQVNKLHTSY